MSVHICFDMPVYESHKEPEPPGGFKPSLAHKHVTHCVEIHEYVELPELKPHRRHNYPELELAATVLSVVDYVRPLVKDSPLVQQLTEVATGFIDKVRAELPAGVSISYQSEAKAKAA